MMKNICLHIGLLLTITFSATAQSYELTSPAGNLSFRLEVGDSMTYTLYAGSKRLIKPSAIGLELYNGYRTGDHAEIKGTKRNEVHGIIPVLHGKNKDIPEDYKELVLEMDSFSLIVRAYDEGIAYRFKTEFSGEIIVKHETAEFNFEGDPDIWFGEAEPEMIQWERSYYPYASIGDIDNGKFAMTPCLLKYTEENICLVVAESDLHDYPGMFVSKAGDDRLKGKWAEYPKKVKAGDYEYKRVLERYDYIARTGGTREFPWRVFIVSTRDKDLLNNELIYKLAKPQVEGDFSWVKPGKSVWEWWHDAILTGVSFPSGSDHLSLTLYKYYIDFAAAHGIEYITLDAGWSTLYVKSLCQYAASKNVKVILWYYFNLVVVNPRILDTFKSYGAAGIKVDLIERDDQLAIQWFELIASECAKRNLVVSFHGCAKPTGLQRAYPNIVNFEAVRGAECSKWDYTANPNYHLQFPFMRMLAGTLDYTPGSLRNVHYEQFTPIPVGVPKTIGTRAHEMAMYVVYDQTLAYLCDAPTEYEKYPELTDFIAKIPTAWDQTMPIDGEVGEYAVMARRKGDIWYAGAMTNLTARDIALDCSFLSPGTEYKAVILRDTRSSDVSAMSYMIEEKSINNKSVLNVALSRGGGVVVLIEPISATSTKEGPETEKVKLWYDSTSQVVMIDSRYDLELVRLTDMSGRNYLSKSDIGSNPCQIPVGAYPSGMYLLSVWSGNTQSELKFLKN